MIAAEFTKAQAQDMVKDMLATQEKFIRRKPEHATRLLRKNTRTSTMYPLSIKFCQR